MNPILFLHGALGTEEQLYSLISELVNDERKLHRFTFEGHGEAEKKERPFRIEHFAENTIRYMDQHGIEQADFFGFSMGGYVALYLAKINPKRVGRIATLGTVLKWSSEKALQETAYLSTEKIEEKVPAFARMLEKQHPKNWRKVVSKTEEMLMHLGSYPVIKDEDWKNIKHTIRIHIGDRDTTADLIDTVNVYNEVPNAELVVLPDSPHPIDKADKEILIKSLKSFLKYNHLLQRICWK